MAWKRLSAINARCTAAKVALAGAGVTIGVSAYLLAVKIKRAHAATAAAVRAPTVDAKPISIAQASGGGNGSPRKTEAASEEKQPCGGCDCGLMEPGPIEGTMHAYERHVIICSGQLDWPKVIEEEEQSLAESIFNMCLGAGIIWTKKAAKEAEANNRVAPKNRIKVTACSEPSRGPEGTTDVIVYPEGLIYTLRPNDLSSLERFVKCQLEAGEVVPEFNPRPVPYKKMVLVCTHNSRDKRCGRAGPQVLDEMAKELEARGVSSDEVALRGSSHFGGHKYAGVLIIYPQGDCLRREADKQQKPWPWIHRVSIEDSVCKYGLVSKRNAAAIMDKCVLGTEGMKANWRGNMSDPGVKASPAPKSAEAAFPAAKSAEAASPAPKMVRRDSVEGA